LVIGPPFLGAAFAGCAFFVSDWGVFRAGLGIDYSLARLHPDDFLAW